MSLPDVQKLENHAEIPRVDGGKGRNIPSEPTRVNIVGEYKYVRFTDGRYQGTQNIPLEYTYNLSTVGDMVKFFLGALIVLKFLRNDHRWCIPFHPVIESVGHLMFWYLVLTLTCTFSEKTAAPKTKRLCQVEDISA